jgi:hypothetical protein
VWLDELLRMVCPGNARAATDNTTRTSNVLPVNLILT